MDKQRPAPLARNTDIKWRRTIPKLGKRIHVCAIKGRIVCGRCLSECLGMQEERKEREARKSRRVGRKREELAGSRHVVNHMTAIYAGV